jgi:Holliday junction resolvase-like predicted endonuclease
MTTKYLDLAEEVLSNHSRGLHINDIASAIYDNNPNVAEDFDQFSKGLGGALSKAVKAKTPRFIKPKKNGRPRKGWYSLKQHKPPKLAVSGVEKGLSTQNIGSGGEHAVISELLFNGFNAANMAVDDGIDVVASKKNTFYHIQVKTANERADAKYHFSIKRAAFARKTEANTHYVFVMRRMISKRRVNDFLILPQSVLALFDKNGLLKGKDTLSLNISFQGSDRFFLNSSQEVTEYVNNWSTL